VILLLRFTGTGIVWDAENDKALCTFENGEFYTDDKIVINKLKELGFGYEEESRDLGEGKKKRINK
jgi:hypothetical protein